MPDPGIADLNLSRLDGKQNSAAETATAINSMPFLAESRLAILENVLPNGRDEAAREKFLHLLENSPETTHILLVLADEYKAYGAGSGWQNFRKRSLAAKMAGGASRPGWLGGAAPA